MLEMLRATTSFSGRRAGAMLRIDIAQLYLGGRHARARTHKV